MSKKKIFILFIIGIILAAIGGALFPSVDYIIHETIKKKIVISNTSETYDIWQDVPVPVYMQFYIFSVDNPLEIKAGEKPSLSQQGPYTYRERRTKFDIIWNDNGTVSYRQNRTFHFIPEMSVGSEADIITTVNPLIAVIAQSIKWMPMLVKAIMSEAMSLLPDEDLFMARSVKEVLWGYEDPALVVLKSLLPSWFNTTVIGYFIRKNFTDDGVYTVYTGETDSDLVGIISKYNGQSIVNVWSTYWANMINGTDGTLSSPFGFDQKVAQIFVSDMCRSIRGVFKTQVTLPQGINLNQFGADENDLLNATVNKDNIGYCVPQSQCLPTGFLNSTTCQEPVDGFLLPIVFSFPHFLYADPDIQESIVGLSPNQNDHQTLISIEPWTGLVLQVAKRLQINVFIEQVPDMKQTKGIRTLFFPVLWINESSVTDDKHADMLKNELFTPMEIAYYVKVVALALGSGLILLSSVILIFSKCKNPKTVESMVDEAANPCLQTRSITSDSISEQDNITQCANGVQRPLIVADTNDYTMQSAHETSDYTTQHAIGTQQPINVSDTNKEETSSLHSDFNQDQINIQS